MPEGVELQGRVRPNLRIFPIWGGCPALMYRTVPVAWLACPICPIWHGPCGLGAAQPGRILQEMHILQLLTMVVQLD